MDSSQVVLLSERTVADIRVVDQIEDPVFGEVQRVVFREEGAHQQEWAMLWQPTFESISRADLFRLFGSAEQDPSSGYAPKLLGYVSKRRSNTNQEISSEEESSLESVIELLLEPPAENLRTMIENKASDQSSFTEQEIVAFLSSLCHTLEQFDKLGIDDPRLTPERIVVGLPQANPSLYHPWLSDASVTSFDIITSSIRGGDQSILKHYHSPEEVKLALGSADAQEFERKIVEMGARLRCWTFSLGLIILEMASLIQEDSWYDEFGLLKFDILELKLNVFSNQYSKSLSELLSRMVDSAENRPKISEIFDALNIQNPPTFSTESIAPKPTRYQIPTSGYRQLKQMVPNELEPLQSKPIDGLQDSIQRQDNFMFSSKKQPFNMISCSSVDDKYDISSRINISQTKPTTQLSTQRPFQPQQSVGGELSFGLNGGKCYMSSTSQSASQSYDAQKSISSNYLAPLVKSPPPQTQIIQSPPRAIQPIAYQPQVAVPRVLSQPAETIPSRSLSPRVVSVTKYLVKDGQRTLLSREEFPSETTISTNHSAITSSQYQTQTNLQTTSQPSYHYQNTQYLSSPQPAAPRYQHYLQPPPHPYATHSPANQQPQHRPPQNPSPPATPTKPSPSSPQPSAVPSHTTQPHFESQLDLQPPQSEYHRPQPQQQTVQQQHQQRRQTHDQHQQQQQQQQQQGHEHTDNAPAGDTNNGIGRVHSLVGLARQLPSFSPAKEDYQSTSEEFARKFQEVQSILDNLIATREQGVSRGVQVDSPSIREVQKIQKTTKESSNPLSHGVQPRFMEDSGEMQIANNLYRHRDSHIDDIDQVSGIHELLGDEFEQSDPEYEAKPYPNFEETTTYRPDLNSNLDFGEFPAKGFKSNKNPKPRIQPLERVFSQFCCHECKKLDQRFGKAGLGSQNSCQKLKRLTPSTTMMGSERGSGSKITPNRQQKTSRPFSPRVPTAATNRDSSSISRSKSQRTKSSKSRSTSIGPLQRGAKKIVSSAGIKQPNLILEDFCPRYLREITPPKRLQPLPQNELFLQTQILRMLKQRDLKNLKSELLTTSRPVSREPQHTKRIHARTGGK